MPRDFKLVVGEVDEERKAQKCSRSKRQRSTGVGRGWLGVQPLRLPLLYWASVAKLRDLEDQLGRNGGLSLEGTGEEGGRQGGKNHH